MLRSLIVIGGLALTAPSGRAQTAEVAPPTKLWAAQMALNQVTLVWRLAPGATGYVLYRNAVPGSTAGPDGQVKLAALAGNVSRYVYIVRAASTEVQQFYLQATDANGRTSAKVPFNAVALVNAAVAAVPPASVTAKETSPGVITVTWTPSAGATAYAIGRVVGGSGLGNLCALCPTEPTYVDSGVASGIRYQYSVATITPTAISLRTMSNVVTPGVVATTTGGAGVTGGVTSTAGTGGTSTSGSGGTLVNPVITTPVNATSDSGKVAISPAPTGSESLVSPPADTTPCLTARTTADTSGDSLRIDTRIVRVDAKNNVDPTTTTTTSTSTTSTTFMPGSTNYREGKCLNGTATGYPDLWDPVAAASGLSNADQISSWKQIGIVALAYKHLLQRQPTPDETRRDVALLKSGTTWRQYWRQIAQSAERDTRFGYWAPAPIPDATQAKTVFGLPFTPTSQQCFGGLGPKCAGGIPEIVNGNVAPSWFGGFRLPDNTSMAYVAIGVAVGSILHDNACLRDMTGLNCNGLGAGDLIKVGSFPAVMEWNKASWNVIDQRTWRATFGPYPTDTYQRDKEWYDDIRLIPNRPAKMAITLSMLAFPGLTEDYRGGETRQSKALNAPTNTSLDDTDVAFCKSKAFSSTGVFPLKASWGICK